MITSKNELKQYLEYEKELYLPSDKKRRIQAILLNEHSYILFQYLKRLRKTEYYYNKRKNKFFFLLYMYSERKKNKMGQRLGLFIGNNVSDRGLLIYHYGTIIINGEARIGRNCKLHGNNCIGNAGTNLDTPIIGDNVDIGFGAQIIGGVKVANNVTIGSGAIVVKDCLTEGATLVGIPAHIVERGK